MANKHLRYPLLCVLFLFAFTVQDSPLTTENKAPFVIVLGTTQDAGSPQAGCLKECCRKLFQTPDPTRKVVSLGLIDPQSGVRYLFEAGPDFKEQLYELNQQTRMPNPFPWPDGIFITHAHTGHYTGLMQLGKESMNAKNCEVYVLPRMQQFIEQNAPWSQLCALGNIHLRPLKSDSSQQLSARLSVKALQVPHRDEFSETAGFLIQGPNKTLLFIPDIDKWEKWQTDIIELIKTVDYALIDGTFYSADEIKNRMLSEIPHPLVTESMLLFQNLSRRDKSKIHFIHFNHTNPLLDSTSEAYKNVQKQGFQMAKYKQKFAL
ncbi:MAG: MBL fold metallo-hydrolase [Bacteroidia bacterium]|jgi:pyrroloquinoline quinone biosynthesis protein B|nr:MBL fold metallo-hydrolase [Bacteroidia bacterium]